MATRFWIGIPIWFIALAAGAAVFAGAPNDQPITPAAWYVLVALGETSNIFGMGRTMTGAILVTYALIGISILYGAFLVFVPALKR